MVPQVQLLTSSTSTMCNHHTYQLLLQYNLMITEHHQLIWNQFTVPICPVTVTSQLNETFPETTTASKTCMVCKNTQKPRANTCKPCQILENQKKFLEFLILQSVELNPYHHVQFVGFLRQNLGKCPESTKELSYKALVRLIWNMPAQFGTPGKGNT